MHNDYEVWAEFRSLAVTLLEYISPTDSASVNPTDAVRVLQSNFDDAMKALSILEKCRLERKANRSDKKLIADFLWRLSTRQNARGDVIGSLRSGEWSVELFRSLDAMTDAEKLELSRRLNNLGPILGSVGRDTSFLATMFATLQLRIEVEPKDSWLVAGSFHNLSESMREVLKKPSFAIYREAKKKWLAALGDEHNEVAWANHVMGRWLSERGQHDAARIITEKSLQLKEHILGDGHPQCAYVLLNLGEQATRLRDFDTADTYYQRACEIDSSWFGRSSPVTLRVVNARARSLRKSGDNEAAYRLLKEFLTDELWKCLDPHATNFLRELGRACRTKRLQNELNIISFHLSGRSSLLAHEASAKKTELFSFRDRPSIQAAYNEYRSQYGDRGQALGKKIANLMRDDVTYDRLAKRQGGISNEMLLL